MRAARYHIFRYGGSFTHCYNYALYGVNCIPRIVSAALRALKKTIIALKFGDFFFGINLFKLRNLICCGHKENLTGK